MKSFTPGFRKHHLALVAAFLGVVAFACSGSDSGGTGDGSSSGSGSSGNGSSGASSGASSSGASSSGASSSGASSSGASSSGSTSSSSSSSGSSGDGGKSKGAIFVMVFENHDYNEIVGSPNAPFFNSLIAKYGLATNYFDANTHPSLPNYLTMISGDHTACGLVCGLDPDPTFPGVSADQKNLGSQLEAAGIKWRSYQESMGTPCKMSTASPYAPKHNPFLYYKDMQAQPLCNDRNVDYSQFAADLAAGTYGFSFITPNLTDDGHDPGNDPVAALKTSDGWAQAEVGKIMASDAYKNGGVLFITWDEAEGRNGNSADQVPMIVVSENIKSAGIKVNTKYSHTSFLATLEDMMGLGRLDTVKTETNMAPEFLK